MTDERVAFAAIDADGIVFVGKRHHNVLLTLDDCGYDWQRIQTFQQGFVTDGGRFVGREEAATIALNAGQIQELKYSNKELFSEDLY